MFGKVGPLALVLSSLLAMPAIAAIQGAIHTTTSDGTTVNANLYPGKDQVYLTGGPQNTNAAGLTPDGLYYFQVTDPSGASLLSIDSVYCRAVIVTNGVIVGVPTMANDPNYSTDAAACANANNGSFHALGSFNSNNNQTTVQLIPYNDSPNAGGEYKAWLSTDPTFQSSTTKTDNFKVKNGAAYITVCKFNDLNDDGTQDPGDPRIPGWPITATGVDSETGGTNQTITVQTDATGCVAFSISDLTASSNPRTVTLTEGTLGTGWTQTAPGNGTYDTNGNAASTGPTTVTGGVISVSVNSGDSITAPNFGNANPNCATASACGGTSLTVTKDASPGNKYTWAITKIVDKTQINTSSTGTFNYTVTVTHDAGTGWVVTGNISVSNPTPADITATITDAVLSGNATCVITDVNQGTNELISAGAQNVKFPYKCTYPGAAMPPADTNTGAATWASGSASGTAPIDFSKSIMGSSVAVTDTVDGATSPTTLGTVTIHPDGTTSFTVSNGINGQSTTTPDGAIFTYALTFNDPAGTCTSHTNTAGFSTGDTPPVTGSAAQTVKDCVGADLTVSKTATAAFSSSISKSVNKTTVQQSGGNVAFNYTVTVIESQWTVTGNITVTNPNDWEPITADVTDAIDSGGTCVVTGGASVTIAKGSFVSLPYTCTYSLRPTRVSGTNVATAAWNFATAYTPDGMKQGSAGYMFNTLTITDTVQSSTNPTGCAATLGTVSVTATSPNGTPGCGVTSLASVGWGVFTYTITDTNSTPGTCASYNNTAAITGGASSGQVTVTVCNTQTGALTMGFWKNTNGQNIIGKSCVGTTGTSLWAYLGQFNPFKDDTTAAYPTCAKEATYVANVIGSATCSSSSNTCNTMLRAQMLATALDVYFSTPGLGGNQIGAYNGLGSKTPALGSVVVDLSKVCLMIDGSTSTCGGAYEDARLEFGIASSCSGASIGQMLSYANFPSSVNGNPVATATTGAIWYGQLKAKQVSGKDSFDSFNNAVANIATSAACGSTF